jgi:hypothetical protein
MFRFVVNIRQSPQQCISFWIFFFLNEILKLIFYRFYLNAKTFLNNKFLSERSGQWIEVELHLFIVQCSQIWSLLFLAIPFECLDANINYDIHNRDMQTHKKIYKVSMSSAKKSLAFTLNCKLIVKTQKYH